MFTKNEIARIESVPTPFYYYRIKVLNETLKMLKDQSSKYDFHVHYALKANANDAILQSINEIGLGADCVSGNEVKKAIEIGFRPEDIVFAGVGKNDEEINYSLQKEIFCFNCESQQELEVINELAKAQNKIAAITLRINPNVNANTHHYITTGLEENKFGINPWELDQMLDLLKNCSHIRMVGLHFHIGSQITDLSVFKSLCIRVNELQQWFAQRHIRIEHLNMGGGLGVNYQKPEEHLYPDFESYFGLFNEFLEIRPGQKVHFELGRAIVAQCGSLISRVLYVKKGINTSFVILDAGMTELIRPALYQARHYMENLNSDEQCVNKRYDVVGPVCESSDCFGKSLMLPETKRGDLYAIHSAGAYGEVMSSQYNLRERVKAFYDTDFN